METGSVHTTENYMVLLSDVPMRNGNFLAEPDIVAPTNAFGCPYEEWKRVSLDRDAPP